MSNAVLQRNHLRIFNPFYTGKAAAERDEKNIFFTTYVLLVTVPAHISPVTGLDFYCVVSFFTIQKCE